MARSLAVEGEVGFYYRLELAEVLLFVCHLNSPTCPEIEMTNYGLGLVTLIELAVICVLSYQYGLG